jgi:hypothetical protein
MRLVKAFGRFWWDFVVGDEWRIAAGVVVVLGAGALATAGGWLSQSGIVVAVAAGIVSLAILSIVLPARRSALEQRADAGPGDRLPPVSD